MRSYIAIVHHDRGSAWGLTFPDLPGCFAAADRREDIPAAGAEALSLWFQDAADVAPTPLEAIRARPEVAAECAAGAILVPVPYDPAKASDMRITRPAIRNTGNGAGEGT